MPELTLSRREVNKILKQAQSGNITQLINLKEQDPLFHWSTLKYPDTGDTVLHHAARLGYINTVKYLLSYVPSGINCKNNDDKTALHEAAQFSQYEVVKILIGEGAQINALKRADWTPLMLACTKKCPKTVKLLAENGGLINYQNKDGWTCMHLAAREGCGEIFRFLIEKGGDCEIRTKNGRAVLHVAALHGSVQVMEILLKSENLDVNVKDNCGNTPLHESVLGRNIDICKMLIGKGAQINCLNNVDFNILHLAASVGYETMVEFITNDLNFDINVSNSNGFTALHCAARKGRKEMCDFLIRLGCKKDLRDKFDRVAFDYLN